MLPHQNFSLSLSSSYMVLLQALVPLVFASLSQEEPAALEEEDGVERHR